MKTWLVKTIEKALNRYIALDPESKTRLQRLESKTVTLDLLGLGLTLQLVFMDEKIHLKTNDFFIPDTHIKGTPLTLLRMALTSGDRKQFFAEDVSIEGNLDLGQDVIDLFDQLEIDWEEYLSHWMGDVPAHQLGRFAHKIKKFSQRTSDALLQNINEYVHEEVDWFPAREALQDFFNDIDEIRMDVDRIATKISHLKKQLGE